MSKGPSAPKTPSASEQAAGNIQTAQANAQLANPTQVTPWGTLTSSFTPGSNQWTQSLELSPEVQQQFGSIQNAIMATIPGVATGAGNVSGFDPASYNFDAARREAQDAAYNQATGYLDPQFARAEDKLSNDLANRGLGVGTEAWKSAMDQFGEQKRAAYADASNQAFGQGLSAESQGFAQGMQGRQQQLSENQIPLQVLSALLGLQQGQQPSFSGVQSPSVQGIDWNTVAAGNIAKSQAQAQQNAGWSSLLGSGLGVGGTLGGLALLSDRAAKTDIHLIGMLPSGIGLYRFRYAIGGPIHVGVMADEVRAIRPEAVVDGGPHGFARVDYGAIQDLLEAA